MRIVTSCLSSCSMPRWDEHSSPAWHYCVDSRCRSTRQRLGNSSSSRLVGCGHDSVLLVRVGRTGGPPIITSIAATEAYVGRGYLYSVQTLAGEGKTFTYRLLAAPAGMEIESTTGEIAWTPTLEQLGQQAVVLEVSDVVGNASTQSFAVRVRAGVPNQPPRITSAALDSEVSVPSTRIRCKPSIQKGHHSTSAWGVVQLA